MTAKRLAGLGFVCIGFFGMVVYSLQVFYLRHTSFLDFKEWDLETLTAADFTAELTITEQMYDEFLRLKSSVQEPMPTHACPSIAEMGGIVTPMYQYLETEILRRIVNLPQVVRAEPNLRIAHISFAYDNKDLIELLIKRGTIISKGQFSKLKDINEKID